MSSDKREFTISDDIKHLKIDSIYDNLFHYKYHSRYLKKLQNSDMDKDDPHYISTYSSFVGEVYENIVYELLLDYALNSNIITRFVLKGPHQNHYKNYKNGLMIDINDQIVYKAGYKDVTEFDALFFTKDSVYFVESTIVKTTTNLRKRLKKKKALLEVIFPTLKVKSLIILTKGALGVSVFPSYCTVWLTDSLINEDLIKELVYNKNDNKNTLPFIKNKKLSFSHNIKTKGFKYFDTLLWILKSTRRDKKSIIDLKFLQRDDISRYFEIFSKFYIGHINTDCFVRVLKYLKITTISEEIPLEKIMDNQIVVTIEKDKDSFVLVYYLKIINDKLKRLDVNDEVLQVTNKDPKGFTAAEIKFMKYVFNKQYQLYIDDIKTIENEIESIAKK